MGNLTVVIKKSTPKTTPPTTKTKTPSTAAVNGNWGAWTAFSICTKSCDGGTQQRSRVCDSPATAFGGAPCSGHPIENKECNTQDCPGNF